MKLPAFNLPGLRADRGGRPTSAAPPLLWPAVYLLLFAMALVISFHLFFPGSLVQTRLVGELNRLLPFPVQLRGTELGFPFRLQIGELRLKTPETWSLPPFSGIVLTPVWSSLLGNAGVELRGATPGGSLQAAVRRSGELKVIGQGLGFAAPLGQLNLSLAGGVADCELSFTPKGEENGDIQLSATLARVDLQGLEAFGIPSDLLRLGAGRLEIKGDRKQLDIEEFTLAEGDLGVTAKGSVSPGNSPADTRLNLSVTLTPAADLDPNLRQMLSLLAKPAGDGSIRFRLTGTLASPRTK